jgi:peptide-methionine (S)-S-oxide reductase
MTAQAQVARLFANHRKKRNGQMSDVRETATVAGGCFWCVEAVFKDLRGVEAVESGYIGGHIANPTYREVCGGATGHAEAIRIIYDPAEIGYADLLDVFFATHEPTQLNRQGNDVGTQYRSAIFPHDAAQHNEAELAIIRAQPDWPAPIVTTIEPIATWYPAEDYHQNYWTGEGQRNPYCLAVIPPKIAKLRKGFAEKLKA